MYFLKSAFFALLFTIATLFSLALAGDSFAHIQKTDLETLHLVIEYFSGDIILPSTITDSLVDYKMSAKIESNRTSIESPETEDKIFYSLRENLENHAQRIIYPFHSFW